jgi:predicted ATPase/class 3 adenylate cyclase
MSEVRALLLTDVVDSTKLSEEIGDAAMAGVWAAHDRVARDLLPVHRGREIDKTDGMLLLFETAQDAVAYAVEYHKALAGMERPLMARVGLHVGAVILRENSADDVLRGAKPLEVDGLAKPTAARVMSIARGGQTLLTPEARQALGQTAFKLESHGHWMIKGISDPLELFEVGEPGQRFVPPPDGEKVFRVVRTADWWLPVKDIPNNLPFQGSSFIGRERELDEVKALLRKSRLVTLLGMGGLGKTRLSLQVAAETIQEYPDGAWFLDLSPLRDPSLVMAEAARVLDVREEPERPLVQTVCNHLKAKRALIVVDNCEHLVHACADLTNAILKAAPHVRMITSSRETLRVPGEHAYPILPLPLPKPGDSLEALAQSTAVRLFVARAQQHKPSFELNEREGPAVAELVSRLEGIPLALELAAVRVRAMSVADINKRLKDRYKILIGGDRVLQERQQTLRALVDWSYELLNENEQRVLQRLGVFSGGFDLAAAEAVCGADPIDSLDVLDLLQSLVEKSLAMIDDSGESTRYRMLDTIRDYAQEKLADSGERAQTAVRHCLHFFSVAKELRSGIHGADQAEWVQRGELELDNFRSAIALALAGGIEAVLAVKLAVALQGFWTLRGYCTEGRAVVKAALELPEVQQIPVAQAHALYTGASLAISQSDHAEGRQMLETCLELRRGLGNPLEVASALSTLSLTRLAGGDEAGATAAETEAIELFKAQGFKMGETVGFTHLGLIALHHADLEAARTHYANGLALARQIKFQEAEGDCQLGLGQAAYFAGDLAQAETRFKQALLVCHDAADKKGEAAATYWLGRLELDREQFEPARQHLDTALKAFRACDMREEWLDCLEAIVALRMAVPDRVSSAVQIAAAVTHARERLDLRRPGYAEAVWQGIMSRLQAALPRDAFDAHWNVGSQWHDEEAVTEALR